MVEPAPHSQFIIHHVGMFPAITLRHCRADYVPDRCCQQKMVLRVLILQLVRERIQFVENRSVANKSNGFYLEVLSSYALSNSE